MRKTLIAIVLAFAGAAQAEPNPACVQAVNENVPLLHEAFVKQNPPPLIRYLLRTDDEIGDKTRKLLLDVLQAMETAQAFGKRMSQSDTMEYAMGLCEAPVRSVPRVRELNRPADLDRKLGPT